MSIIGYGCLYACTLITLPFSLQSAKQSRALPRKAVHAMRFNQAGQCLLSRASPAFPAIMPLQFKTGRVADSG